MVFWLGALATVKSVGSAKLVRFLLDRLVEQSSLLAGARWLPPEKPALLCSKMAIVVLSLLEMTYLPLIYASVGAKASLKCPGPT